MKHNELIRKLRRERGLSQTELSSGICSRNALSTFETDGSKMSFENCLAFCEKMNITLEEYEYQYLNAQIGEKRIVAKKVKEGFQNDYCSDLAQELLDMYADTNDFYYYSLYAQYFLLGNLKSGQLKIDEATNIIEIIKVYLDTVDVWGRFELVLFNNCMFMFESKYIAFQFHESIRLMRVYSDSANYSADLLAFLVNGTQLMYERKSEDEFTLFLNELMNVAQKCRDYRTVLACEVFTYLRRVRDGDKINQGEKEQLLVVLQFFKNKKWYRLVSDALSSC